MNPVRLSAVVADRLLRDVETMREISRHHDPQVVVRIFGERMREWIAWDGMVSLSRRELVAPDYRIARSSAWKEEVNPWIERRRLPVYRGGVCGWLMDQETPVLINDLDVASDDPAYEHLVGYGSVVSLPVFDQGRALNVVLWLRKARHAFKESDLPDWVWMANLFGRSTNNLVLRNELATAYAQLDRELATLAEVQASLLPAELPRIEGADLAVHYRTSRQAGGDHYDFFPLSEGRLGILVADVCGHGTPAAVLMAISHCLARSYPGSPDDPAALFEHLNTRLLADYTRETGKFVAAAYAVFDPKTRTLTYATAGFPPLRRKTSSDQIELLEGGAGPPLGILQDLVYPKRSLTLSSGDFVLFQTDGFTEARRQDGEMFGEERLDSVLRASHRNANALLAALTHHLHDFLGTVLPADDLTLLALHAEG